MMSQSDSAKTNSPQANEKEIGSKYIPNNFNSSFSFDKDSTKRTKFSLKNLHSPQNPLKKDSSFSIKGLVKDSLLTQQKGKLRGAKDSLLKKNNLGRKLKQTFQSGNISLGYDYGFLPYTVNMPSPASAFKSEGLVGVNVLGLPIDVTWFYSSQKNLIGLSKYFRISYNADRYKDQLNSKVNGSVDKYKNQLGGLFDQRQQLMQKMAYSDYLSTTSPDKWPIDSIAKKNNLISKPDSNQYIPQYSKPDSTKYTSQYRKPDSTAYLNNYSKSDSLKNNKYTSKADSVEQRVKEYKHKTDSVKNLYDTYKNQYDQINDSIKKTQKKIDQAESLTNGNYSKYLSKIPYFNKIQNFLSGVKKFEIGLCYPNYSTFLANNIPVRGINLEYGKNNVYFAFTYGTTVSTLLYNNKTVDGFLQNVHNSYNYFDFNNLSAGRKIISVKFGAGTKEGNHLFVGILIGKGQSTYLNPLPDQDGFKAKESNLVLELDARYKFKTNTTFDIILGKSSLKQEDLNYEVIKTSFNEVFSDYRSYALLTKLTTKINLTKTNLTFTFRWIDPLFKSFGIGFIRSDNMRYEIKLDQPLTKTLRYTGMFRYEEDNLLQLMNFKNRFYSINNTISYKIKRGLMLRLSYTPLFRTLSSPNYSFSNNNSISTGVITFTPKTRKTSLQFNFLYNYYIVNTDTQQINFQNIAYYHQVTFKSGLKTGLNLSWFKNTLRDTLNNNVFLGVLDFGYQFKNGSSITVAAKSAYKINSQLYPGFMIKTNLRLYRKLFWENQVEKFIVGDLFNGYDYQNLKKYPYYYSTRLIYNF